MLLEDMHIDMHLGFRGWVVTLRETIFPVLSRDQGDFGCRPRVVIFISDRVIFRRNLPPDMTHRNRCIHGRDLELSASAFLEETY